MLFKNSVIASVKNKLNDLKIINKDELMKN